MTVVELPQPTIIQGGMGVGVSGWSLARAVAQTGQMGVVSGTALDTVMVRRLQDGDPGGHVRRAMAHFPVPEVVDHVLGRFLVPGGRPAGDPYQLLRLYNHNADPARQILAVLANFVEVRLAKEGHDGPIGLNLLTKIHCPNLASIYGAMLGGVDAVLMGAGIPRDIPAALDRLADHEPAETRMDVDGGETELLTFDPAQYVPRPDRELCRPAFIPIVSSATLASALTRRQEGGVNGFVVERPVAGGHNAPPRGRGGELTDRGEPVYGPRDDPDLDRIRALGLPFWIAGGVGSPAGVTEARSVGAAGVQVGTLFAWCCESGIADEWKTTVLESVREGRADVFTDPLASPTGFPFKVVDVEGTVADADVYSTRKRICDLGYLRTAYRREDGRIGYRCPAEPVETYVAKGGRREDTLK